MAYEMYKRKMSKTDYFTFWNTDKYDELTEDIKTKIYDKYLLKCLVFERDSYKCQNSLCKTPDSPLTMHHDTWQKDGGKDLPENCVTLCKSCHKGLNRAKLTIVYYDADYLPANIRGKSDKLTKPYEIDWKQIRKEMRTLRKNLKSSRIYLTLKDIAMLMKFLEINFMDGDDD